MRTAKAKIRLRGGAVWSGPSLSAKRIIVHYRTYKQRANARLRLCACADWIWICAFLRMFEDPFLLDVAQIRFTIPKILLEWKVKTWKWPFFIMCFNRGPKSVRSPAKTLRIEFWWLFLHYGWNKKKDENRCQNLIKCKYNVIHIYYVYVPETTLQKICTLYTYMYFTVWHYTCNVCVLNRITSQDMASSSERKFLWSMCEQRKPRSGCADAQSDQSLRCPQTESLSSIII